MVLEFDTTTGHVLNDAKCWVIHKNPCVHVTYHVVLPVRTGDYQRCIDIWDIIISHGLLLNVNQSVWSDQSIMGYGTCLTQQLYISTCVNIIKKNNQK